MQQRAAGRGPARGAHGHGIADPRRDVRGGTERYPGGAGWGVTANRRRAACTHRGPPASRVGNSCYHVRMAKTQLGARVDEDVAELARKRAADLGLSVGDYLARLVQDDASGLRARAVDAAARFLAEHQDVFDEAEDAQQTSPGARAA